VVPASPTTTPIPAVAAASEPPTPSPSATSQTLLAQTGPSQPPRAGPSPIWFLLGASILVLAALAAINLRRRGP
jgi:hypothetical protein